MFCILLEIKNKKNDSLKLSETPTSEIIDYQLYLKVIPIIMPNMHMNRYKVHVLT